MASVSSCDVYICNGVNNGAGTVSAGVIATAAQDIHSYCRLNGKVGGRVVVSDPDNNHANSVMIQLGFLNKDELRARSPEYHVALDQRSEDAPPQLNVVGPPSPPRQRGQGPRESPGCQRGRVRPAQRRGGRGPDGELL